MLTRTMICIALAGSLGCLRATEPVAAVEATPHELRAAELEQKLVEARQQLALRNASLEQASVMQASLDSRIEELIQLNEEIVARLRTAAETAQLATESACLTPAMPVAYDTETTSSEMTLAEAPNAGEGVEPVEMRHDEGLPSSPRPSRAELAVSLETD